MHYGPEQSLVIGSKFAPFPLNTYEKKKKTV